MELADTAAVKERSDHSPTISGGAVVLYLAGVTLVFHLLTASRYGIFRDELYYLACSEHLDWGYVDQPPLIAFIAWVARHVFGDSLLGLRLLPALAAAALVWVSGKITKEIGGGGFAQGLAALAVVVVPVYLIFQHWLTMNAFEPLIWMGCAWCIVRAINRSEPQYWLAFGVLAGVGMENKYSMAFFVFGTLVGLLLTPERRFLRSRWIWLGALVAILIFLPNLLWLVRHNFPFLELMHNIRRSGRDVVRGHRGPSSNSQPSLVPAMGAWVMVVSVLPYRPLLPYARLDLCCIAGNVHRPRRQELLPYACLSNAVCGWCCRL